MVKKKTQRIYIWRFQLFPFQTHCGPCAQGYMEKENPDSSEFTLYDRYSGKRFRIDRIYTDIKIATNTKIYHVMVFFTDYYNAISFGRNPSKTKIEKD